MPMLQTQLQTQLGLHAVMLKSFMMISVLLLKWISFSVNSHLLNFQAGRTKCCQQWSKWFLPLKPPWFATWNVLNVPVNGAKVRANDEIIIKSQAIWFSICILFQSSMSHDWSWSYSTKSFYDNQLLLYLVLVSKWVTNLFSMIKMVESRRETIKFLFKAAFYIFYVIKLETSVSSSAGWWLNHFLKRF